MKTKLFYPIFFLLATLILSCSDEHHESRLIKKWVLTEVVGSDPNNAEVLGINNIYFDLKDDESMSARWYKADSVTEFEDYEGKWSSLKFDKNGSEEYDLFLFYGPGQKKSKIFTVTKIEENKMTMRISEIDHVFTAK